jgi:hypothetical protein
LIYDYYRKIEARTSELGIIAEKAVEFREFDIDEGFMRGRILFIDGSVLEFLEYLKGDARLKYRFHYMDDQGTLVFRYDNAPHHNVSIFPDHKHTPSEVIAASPRGVLDVIGEIEKLMSRSRWI